MVVTFTRGDYKMVFKNVPSLKCKECSEEYISEETSALLLNLANESLKKGEGSFVKDFNKDNPPQY
jgi:YgiT-type zinc finger domain-containing protein